MGRADEWLVGHAGERLARRTADRAPSIAALRSGDSKALLLFTILWLYTRRPRPRYTPSGLFLLCYSLARITVEFVRVPDVQLGYLADGWLTMGQLLSLPMLLAGILLLMLARRPAAAFRQLQVRQR